MNRFFYQIALHAGPVLARAYLGLVRLTSRVEILGEKGRFEARERGGIVHVFWHRNILCAVPLFRGQGAVVLISRSRDGELIARCAEAFGHRCVRGSSSRGGSEALLELEQKLLEGAEIAITPDGPRGPSQKVQPGCIGLASRTGCPILPVGFFASRKIVLKSWDRMVIPLPFGRIRAVFGETYRPASRDVEELERKIRAMDAKAEAGE